VLPNIRAGPPEYSAAQRLIDVLLSP